MSIFFLIAMILIQSGCAHRINWSDPADIAKGVQVQQDDFRKVTSFIGPNCAPDPMEDTLKLRAFKGRDGTTEYQVYVADEYTSDIGRSGSGWRFYNNALDSDGTRLEMITISRSVDTCGRYRCFHTEIIGVQVSREYLEERTARGLRFKIGGTGGEEVFWVPPAYVQAFLSVAK